MHLTFSWGPGTMQVGAQKLQEAIVSHVIGSRDNWSTQVSSQQR